MMNRDKRVSNKMIFFRPATAPLSGYPQKRLIMPEEMNSILDDLYKNVYMTHLDLSFSNLGDHNVRLLAKALLKNTTLRSLNLSCSQMTDTGLKALVRMLVKNDTLVEIDVSFNLIVQTDLLGHLQMLLKMNVVSSGMLQRSNDPLQVFDNPMKDMPVNKLTGWKF